jgi:uncharacterized protein
MTPAALQPHEVTLIISVLRQFPVVTCAAVFGSRAKGTQHAASDVDLAVWGGVPPLVAEALKCELENLPLPYHFDVQPFECITNPSLREHIERVGFRIYESDRPQEEQEL